MIRIVAISDTHGLHRQLKLPDGDVLVHAGDITRKGEMDTIVDFTAWLLDQPHRRKIVIAGNHDYCFDISRTQFDGLARRLLEDHGIHYLQDATRTIDGVKFFGAPWCPNLPNWAFYDRNRDYFESAPRDIDVLITHAPPAGILDASARSVFGTGDAHIGSPHIVRYINRCPRLKLHIFGHVHEGYGRVKQGEIEFVNASSCKRAHEQTNTLNEPIVVDLDLGRGASAPAVD